jgi:hypothetical protein
MIVFSPCSCSLYLGEVFCLICGGCETVFQYVNTGQCRNNSRRIQINVKKLNT